MVLFGNKQKYRKKKYLYYDKKRSETHFKTQTFFTFENIGKLKKNVIE